MALDIWFFALAIPAVFFAGVSKSGFGSGAAFVSASILALILEPGLALGIMLPLLMLIDAVTMRPYWGKWRAQEATLMVIGAVPGVAIGAVFYQSIHEDGLRVLIGAISVGFVLWQLSGIGRRRSETTAAVHVGVLAGCVAGFTSFVSHAGGPPAAIYLLGRRLEKTEYQATTVLVFTFVNVMKAVPYGFLGLFTAQTMYAGMYLAPFAVFGAWAGVRLHRLVSARLFFALTYILLFLTGSKLMWDGLT